MARRSRRHKSKSSSSGVLKLLVLLIVIAGVAFTGVSMKGNVSLEEVKSVVTNLKNDLVSSSETSIHVVANGKELKERLEYVVVKDNVREEIIEHTGYTVSHNSKWKLPNWVGYELTRREVAGQNPRDDCFAPDPMVKGNKAELSDYKGSGYDRGHMAPAADMKWSKKVMKESFYLSNMCPQNPSLNRGDWNDLEEKVRSWAKRDSAIIVVCGPIVSKRPKKIGNNLAVPEAFFKVVLSPYGKNPQAIGFIMPNEAGNNPLSSYAKSIDEVEALTKMDFFSVLPDELENRIEAGYNLKYWNLK